MDLALMALLHIVLGIFMYCRPEVPLPKDFMGQGIALQVFPTDDRVDFFKAIVGLGNINAFEKWCQETNFVQYSFAHIKFG